LAGGRGRQRFSRTRGERVSVSVAAQKPEIDNGESDCRLAVEAVGGGARGMTRFGSGSVASRDRPRSTSGCSLGEWRRSCAPSGFSSLARPGIT